MKIQATADVQTNITGSQDFGFGNNASKLFYMLSNALYSDKEYCVISELAANAIDAHKLVGKESVPIIVNIPTSLSNEVVIRDFGPGLSEADVYRFLTKYGESSKQDSNEFIGAWGIGSKSPAAVTDTWHIVSHHDGMMKQYTVYIKDDGTPTLVKLFEKETKETGIEVKIPVAKTHNSNWYNAVIRAFRHYPVKPTINQVVNWAEEKYSFKDEFYGFRTRKSQSARIITSNREYTVDKTKIMQHAGDNNGKNYRELLDTFSIDMFFNIGDLSLSISRESLQYDKKTLDIIVSRLELIYQALVKEGTDAINNQKTWIDSQFALINFVQTKIGYFSSYLERNLVNVFNAKWNTSLASGDLYKFKLTLPNNNIKVNFYHKGKPIRRQMIVTHTAWKDSELHIDIRQIENLIFVNPNDRFPKARAIYASESSDKNYVYLEGVDLKKLPKQFHRVNVSALPRRPKQERVKVKGQYMELNGRKFSKTETVPDKTDLVIHIGKCTLLESEPEFNSPEMLFIRNNRWMLHGKNIYATKTDLWKKHMQPKDILNANLKAFEADPEIQKRVKNADYASLINKIRYSYSHKLVQLAFNLPIDISPKWNLIIEPIAEFIKEYKINGDANIYRSTDYDRYLTLKERMGQTVVKVTKNISAEDVEKDLQKYYPMLSYGSWNSGLKAYKETDQTVLDVVDYIRSIN